MILDTTKDYIYAGKKVKIINQFEFDGREFEVIQSDDDFYDKKLYVCTSFDLTEYEKSNTYLNEVRKKKEMEEFETKQDEIVLNIQKKALEALELRLKINSIFSDNGQMSQVGLVIAQALKKIIDGYSVDTMKDTLKEKV
jgi:hypothetical protein